MPAALDELAREIDPGADLVLARPHGEPVLDDRRLRRRAAHVERDQPRPARQAAEVGARHHARRGPRLDQVRRPAGRRLGGERAAARLHHVEPRLDAGRAQPIDEGAEVAGDRGADVGVDNRRRRAFVLADLGQDLGRPGHVDAVAEDVAHDLLDPSLVHVVGIGVEERDRDRLDLVSLDLRDGCANALLVEVAPALAARAEPLLHFVAAAAGNERRRQLVLDVVEHRDPEPAHFEHVAKAFRRHERRAGAVALEDRVRGDGRGVDDVGDRVRRRRRARRAGSTAPATTPRA